MQFLAPESLSEQIAQHMGWKIIKGQMKSGERIQELKVAAELDVSRGTVREALLILERRHLVDIYPRKGAVVSELTKHQVTSLYEVYIHLLILLVERLSDKIEKSQEQTLLQQVLVIEHLLNNTNSQSKDVIEAGFELMQLCFPIVQNLYLEEALLNYRPAVSRTYYLVLDKKQSDKDRTLSFFTSLVAAVQGKNKERIRTVLLHYGETQRDMVLEALGN